MLLAMSERTVDPVTEFLAIQELAEGSSYQCPECRKSKGLGTPLKRKFAEKYVPSYYENFGPFGIFGGRVGIFVSS